MNAIPMLFKTCVSCGQRKPETDFAMRTPEVRRNQCVPCRKVCVDRAKAKDRARRGVVPRVLQAQTQKTTTYPTWHGPVSEGPLRWSV